jgi:hypothetical protein
MAEVHVDTTRPSHVLTGVWTNLTQHCISQEKNPNFMQYLFADLAKLGEVLKVPEFTAAMDIKRHNIETRFNLVSIDDVAAAN